MDLRYLELKKELLTNEHVNDINRLLPQLAPDAARCTFDWLYRMLGGGTRLFAALDGEKIVGTVLLVPMLILVGQKDWIEDVVVDEDYRRLGIASVLMGMAEQASQARSAKSINLTSNPARGTARQMYEKRGYSLRDTGVFRLTF